MGSDTNLRRSAEGGPDRRPALYEHVDEAIRWVEAGGVQGGVGSFGSSPMEATGVIGLLQKCEAHAIKRSVP